MADHINVGAAAPGPVAPAESDEALTTVDAAQGFREQGATDKRHSPSGPHAGQALRVLNGERKAADFLARLRGFCRMIEKALGVAHA